MTRHLQQHKHTRSLQDELPLRVDCLKPQTKYLLKHVRTRAICSGALICSRKNISEQLGEEKPGNDSPDMDIICECVCVYVYGHFLPYQSMEGRHREDAKATHGHFGGT